MEDLIPEELTPQPEPTEAEKERMEIQQKVKAEYPLHAIYELQVPTNDEETEFTYAYVRRPERKILSAISAIKDPMKSTEALLKNTLIEKYSDIRILTDDDLFLSAARELDKLVIQRKSSLKKI